VASPADQEQALAAQFFKLMSTLTRHDVPLTLLEFPRLVSADWPSRHACRSPVDSPSARPSSLKRAQLEQAEQRNAALSGELDRVQAELHTIHGSRAWRAISRYRRFRAGL
jgi:hypothetical protein